MKPIHRKDTAERKHYTANKYSSGCKNAKLLYAGELKKTAHWQEEPHSHPFYEIAYVKSGTGVLRTADREFVIGEGDLLIYAPGTLHSEASWQDKELSLVFCGIDQLRFQSSDHVLLQNNDLPVFKTGELKEVFEGYFSLLLHEVREKSYYYDEIARSLVTIILNLILRLFGQNDEEKFKTNDAYLNARKFIDENYETIESVEDICRSVYISRYYLTHLFKEYSGMSPVQYIISKRMEKAKQLLASTSLSVREIAQMTGYTEEQSFLKIFKKTENMTPSEFRKKNKTEKV